ncbi:MAG: phosphate ABC transporter permease PstA [Bacilli bacterium]|nr:phosphate ABC transporter permease PstA [Bacilli bacterium]
MRKVKDIFLNCLTYLCSSFGFIILIILIAFIFKNGIGLLDFDLLKDDYFETVYNVKIDDPENFRLGGFQDPKLADGYFSQKWGIVLVDDENNSHENIVVIAYISEQSPFNSVTNVSDESRVKLKAGYEISKISLTNAMNDYISALAKNGAEEMVTKLEEATIITDMIVTTGGGGIRGSLLTTFYLIGLTLMISLPLGISGAIYLNEYSKKNRFIGIIRAMIDMTSGIPSIIFGLVGAIIFIPAMNSLISSTGGSIASGALTLSIILLPIIIKTTEESLKVIPDSYRMASLALGASRTQTTFKVVLPNAFSGILTATLLSIGRIIGESAALIYAVGTAIKDTVVINEKSTSLAVHIWSLMSGENPNYELACAISIIILIVVALISLVIKIISKRASKMEVN